MANEVFFRVNSLQFEAKGTVTTTAQKLEDIFSIPQLDAKSVVITNEAANDVYFGAGIAVSVDNAGGVIKAKNQRELPLFDLRYSPYFIASGNSSIRIEVWG